MCNNILVMEGGSRTNTHMMVVIMTIINYHLLIVAVMVNKVFFLHQFSGLTWN